MCELCDRQLTGIALNRRRFIAAGIGLAATGLAVSPPAEARRARSLSFHHTHTGERLRVTFAEDGEFVPDALAEVSHFLRDFRTGDQVDIDPELLNLLHVMRERAGSNGTYEIISAYRSPRTNEMLRDRGSAVAQRSLHMDGRAIDVRLRGVPTRELRKIALDLQAGGVGYYARSDFLHVDTGRVRSW